MHPFFTYINEYTYISEEDFKEILEYFFIKKFKKKDLLIVEGKISNYMAFIVKGSMYKYYINEKGVKNVVNLYIENWWAGDRESFVNSTPTMYYIEACEDCELLLLSRENTLKLLSFCQAFIEFTIKLDERNNIATQKRVASSISFSAEKRYEDFVNCYPHFIQRFPQHLIASYLGITKDTLSRIRKKMLKK